MTLQRPMFPPVDSTRRRLLTVAVGGGAAAALSIASTTTAAVGSLAVPHMRPALVAAARDMAAAHEHWKTARDNAEKAMATVKAWEAENPFPEGKRKRKRWFRQRDALSYAPAVNAAWNIQMAAESTYREVQRSVALLPAADRADVLAKACLAVVYDGERLSSGPAGLISIAVAYDVVRLDHAVQS